MSRTYTPVPDSDPPADPSDFWVFGYGSLMWRPGFDFIDSAQAVVQGLQRDMCLTSIHYRGTPEKPGMVCGLSPGGVCRGRAFRVAPENIASVVAYLDERELISYIYVPRHVPITFDDGRQAIARVYIPDASHAQFAGGWPLEKKAQFIAQGVGSQGSSVDYLDNIVAHLREMKISDENLEGLLRRARQLTGA